MSSIPLQLYGEPFISRRESIAWIPSTPPFEDSDVLVLSSRSTSPGGVGDTLFYLDLRLSLPLGRSSKINWGFAGLRRIISTSPTRYQWEHNTIDSRGDGVIDEGEMTQRDGVDVETGVGFNPATGRMEPYEEIWRDEQLPAGTPYFFVSSPFSVEEATATMAVLGPHALALSQESVGPNTPQSFEAVRMYRQASTMQTAAWEIVFSTGSSAREQELRELVGLAEQACQYVRGNTICLGRRYWVIWDAGQEGTSRDSL